jgi:4-hydroxy-tetrahydrodipicolinate reductase
MNLLILGRGKTGSLVAEVALSRRHHVRTLDVDENANASALTCAFLAPFDVAIDFTAPSAIVTNAEACIRAGKNMVVGTTGWYDQVPQLREMVLAEKTGFLYGSNFSIGVNLFFEIAATAGVALQYDYSGQIFERHHAQKKDAPSGTAITIQKIVRETGGLSNENDIEIVSFREGDVVGMHELVFNSASDRIYLCHDAKSRLGFAEGAVRAAEWLAGKTGFYEFRNVWREL